MLDLDPVTLERTIQGHAVDDYRDALLEDAARLAVVERGDGGPVERDRERRGAAAFSTEPSSTVPCRRSRRSAVATLAHPHLVDVAVVVDHGGVELGDDHAARDEHEREKAIGNQRRPERRLTGSSGVSPTATGGIERSSPAHLRVIHGHVQYFSSSGVRLARRLPSQHPGGEEGRRRERDGIPADDEARHLPHSAPSSRRAASASSSPWSSTRSSIAITLVRSIRNQHVEQRECDDPDEQAEQHQAIHVDVAVGVERRWPPGEGCARASRSSAPARIQRTAIRPITALRLARFSACRRGGERPDTRCR